MFILFGLRRDTFCKTGFVADFCPICRCSAVFKVVRLGIFRQTASSSHEAAKPNPTNHQRVCQECGIELAADVTVYSTIAPKPAPVSELIPKTFPNLEAVHRERLALEAQLRDSPASLSPERRLELIREPVALLAPAVDRFCSDTSPGPVARAYLLCPPLAEVITLFVHAPKATSVGWWALLWVVSVVGLVLWRLQFSQQRYLQGTLVPLLTKTFHSISPTSAELKLVLDEMRRRNRQIGVLLRPWDVV